MPTPEIPNEVFVAAVREAVSVINRDSHEYNLLILEGGINLDLFRAALGVAYAAGRESAFEGGDLSYDWATRWTESDGYAHITSANSARTGAEQLARKRAKHVMRDVGPGEAVRRVRFIGPWLTAEAGEQS